MGKRVLLVGTDMSVRGDDAIVEGLTQLAADKASFMHVLYVLEPDKPLLVPGTTSPLSDEEALATGPALLRRRIQYDAVLNGLPFPSTRVQAHVRLGSPVETLLQACADYEADTLLVGTHGRRGIQDMRIGSVTDQLLRQAQCPVLIARPKSYHGLPRSVPPDPADNDTRIA